MKKTFNKQKIANVFNVEYKKLKNAKLNFEKLATSEFFAVLFGESSIHGMLHIVGAGRHLLERLVVN